MKKTYMKPTTVAFDCAMEAVMLTNSMQVNEDVQTTDMLTEKKNMWGKESIWD